MSKETNTGKTEIRSLPPAKTQAKAAKRMEDKSMESVDFYFCKRDQ